MNPALIVTSLLLFCPQQDSQYDPSKRVEDVSTFVTQFEYGDDDRVVPLRVYMPVKKSKAPVILFSHGLGGSRDNNPYLGKHWAGRGYVVVFVQHRGSDESVWKDGEGRERLKRMMKAASRENLLHRTKDIPATLDHLAKLNSKKDHKLFAQMDLKMVGMSGHSFGAITTQAVSGQNYGRQGQIYTDKRIKAAVAMSPSPPRIGSQATTFAEVSVPWMLMTGTKDKSRITPTTPKDRQKVFQQLPTKGQFYELVLHDAEHMAFSERRLLGGKQRNPNHHRAILALSTAFWDSYLKADVAARKWLKGESAKQVLEAQDIWRVK